LGVVTGREIALTITSWEVKREGPGLSEVGWGGGEGLCLSHQHMEG
jgi:hypothetical protein